MAFAFLFITFEESEIAAPDSLGIVCGI